MLEPGRDFCFVRSEYPLHVSTRDFALDLLLFIAASTAWSPRNSRVNRLEPEYLGKPSFYLDALDRDVRKAHEQASIGVLLCASKEDKVAEYALSRTRSPALIARIRRCFQTRNCSKVSSMSCTTTMPAKKMSNCYPLNRDSSGSSVPLQGGAFAVSSRWTGALPDGQVLANVGLGTW